MAIKLNAKYLEPFVQSHELDAIAAFGFCSP